MNKQEIEQKIDQGYVLSRIIFELVGNPKEHVEKTIRAYLTNIKTDKEILILKEDYAETVEKEKLWSTYVEAEMLVKSLEKFVWLCVNFMPASIEILKPDKLTYSSKKLTDWFNDLLAKLHEVSMVQKGLVSQNQMLRGNLNKLIKNSILISLRQGKNIKEISKTIGIQPKGLKPFLDAMIQENKIRRVSQKYEPVKKTGPK